MVRSNASWHLRQIISGASKCLSWIDDIRDRYGNVVDEPRHPDIKSGRPWPMQAPTSPAI
ncbi:hypothetical protein [Pseudomonas viridiflava]|uniref:hypothetical protein n=1 Tax=Pseudomonas viridiflava TaxID=33069 RepID=UPI003BF61928